MLFTENLKKKGGNFSTNLIFNEDKKVFDPNKVYKGQENPQNFRISFNLNFFLYY